MISCNACHRSVRDLKDFGVYPIVNQLLTEANYKSTYFGFKIGICESCSLAQLIDPIDPKRFYTNYPTPSENKPNPHAPDLLSKIINLFPKNSKVIDVGCNDGVFLQILKSNGYTNVSGIEPTENTFNLAQAKGLNVKKGFLDSSSIEGLIEDGLYDLVITRQVLEHISNLQKFGKSLHSLLKAEGYLIIEIPNSLQNLSSPDYALWEEHVNYFTPLTLERYLNSVGFKIIDIWDSLFSGTCLSIIAQKSYFKIDSLSIRLENEISQWVNWAQKYEKFKKFLLEEVDRKRQDKKLVLYGVGARSQVACNFLGLASKLDFAVDDSPLKQGKYMPYSKTKIISLQEAEQRDEDYLILLGVNAENEEKLTSSNSFVQKNSFISILPPSNYLLKGWSSFGN